VDVKWSFSVKLVKGLLLLLLILVAMIAGILFSIRNTQHVEIDLLLLQLPAASIAIYLLLSFLAGVLVASIIYAILGLHLRVRNQSLQRQLNHLAQARRQEATS
jgi:putative membrane protein